MELHTEVFTLITFCYQSILQEFSHYYELNFYHFNEQLTFLIGSILHHTYKTLEGVFPCEEPLVVYSPNILSVRYWPARRRVTEDVLTVSYKSGSGNLADC